MDINSDSWERYEICDVKMHSCGRPLHFGTFLCEDVVFSLKNRFTSTLNSISCEFGKPVSAKSERNLLLFLSCHSSYRQMLQVEEDMYKWCRKQ